MTNEQRRDFAASGLAPHLWHAVQAANGNTRLHDWTRVEVTTRTFWEYLALAVVTVLQESEAPPTIADFAADYARRARQHLHLVKGDEPA